MTALSSSISPFQLACHRLWRKPSARISVLVLGVFYALALLADIMAPYSFKNEDRYYSYCPPMTIHWMDDNGLTWPFVYHYQFAFDDMHRRVYLENREQRYPLRFWVKGDTYKFLGLISGNRHILGVESSGRIHVLGADSRGRDLLSRIIYGARISLTIGLLGAIMSFVLGLLVGGVAGYYGGWWDGFLMRVCEVFMMIPGFYLLLALRSAFPDNLNSVQIYFLIVLIFSFLGWASLARIIRGMCLSLKSRDYVWAARAMGLSDGHIILKHLLPHTVSYSIIAITLSIPGYILGESALSLLGLGIQDPYASWGNLLSEAMGIMTLQFAPWILLPALFILSTVMCFNILGDALREALDPMTIKRKEAA